MKVTQTLTVDGRFVDARLVGSSARIVISSAPHAILQPQLAGRRVRLGAELAFQERPHRPSLRPARRGLRADPPPGAVLGARDALDRHRRLRQGARRRAVDLDHGRRPDRLRLADEPLRRDAEVAQPRVSASPSCPTGQSTVIDRFDVSDPDVTTFAGSGEVPGYLLNQFSLSEQGGYLRVASTSRPIWWGPVGSAIPLSQSYVTVLELSGRSARAGRAGLGARPGRADHLGAVHRQHGLRRHLPPGRSALHDRPEHADRAAGRGSSSISPATRPTCSRSGRASCSGSAATSRRRTSPTARSSSCSTSPIRRRRSCLRRRSSAPAPRRR